MNTNNNSARPLINRGGLYLISPGSSPMNSESNDNNETSVIESAHKQADGSFIRAHNVPDDKQYRFPNETLFLKYIETTKLNMPIALSDISRIYAIPPHYILKVIKPSELTFDLYRNELESLLALSSSRYVTELHASAFYKTDTGYFLFRITEGRTLSRFLEEKPSAIEKLRVFTTIVHALNDIHRRGYTHRDIKPTNIWIPYSRDEPIYLFDFSISARTGSPNPRTHTRGYAAPWLSSSDTVTEDIDYYALGKIIRENPISDESVHFADFLQTQGINHEIVRSSGFVLRGGKRSNVQRKRSTRRLRRRRLTTA